jgi:hypothetical protein
MVIIWLRVCCISPGNWGRSGEMSWLLMVIKRLTRTGVWVRFDSALSDPSLSTEVCFAGELETRELLYFATLKYTKYKCCHVLYRIVKMIGEVLPRQVRSMLMFMFMFFI